MTESALDPVVSGAVSAAVELCRQTWPTLEVEADRFAALLHARLAADPAPVETLASWNVTDLYFAFACAEGERNALARLDTTYLVHTARALERMGMERHVVDDALQVVRATLLVKGDRAAPEILDFAGRGPLGGWLLVVASRIAFRAARAARADVPWDEALHEGAGGDLELGYLKRTYGDTFRLAFHEALATLAPPDRLLLQQRYALHTTVVALGRLHGVHASSISRRVAEARERLVAATREAMVARHGLVDGDFSSILRMIRSEIDLSLSTTSEWSSAAGEERVGARR